MRACAFPGARREVIIARKSCYQQLCFWIIGGHSNSRLPALNDVSRSTSDPRMRRILAASSLASLAFASMALAQKSYDPGASDTELKIGNIMSYTGWAESYGA